jgi:hypothetical protein
MNKFEELRNFLTQYLKKIMSNLIFDTICLFLVCLCLWRLADIGHRLEINIIVVQNLQNEIDQLKKEKL